MPESGSAGAATVEPIDTAGARGPDEASVETGAARSGAAAAYEIGSPDVVSVYVDPQRGDDTNDGGSRDTALATVDAAWRAIPQATELHQGVHIVLAAGTYPADALPTYWEARHGTAAAPVILEAADGPGTVVFGATVNMFDVRFAYFIGVTVRLPAGGDAFHCERCDSILLRDVELDGGSREATQETLKVNQSRNFYIERADIHGAGDNAVDLVAVQGGHVLESRIHDATDWCMYAKGGSAHLAFEGNEIFDCGTGGFTAGQGAGFEFMVAPWLHYEAYGIRFVNNVVHDTDGAGLGVNGGYNILYAYNTVARVGTRSHVLEFTFGGRGCDGNVAMCAAHLDAGGWGTVGEERYWIPNRNVLVYANIVANPDGVASPWQHLSVPGPQTPPAEGANPAETRADDKLQIRGNVVWNGGAELPVLGNGDTGCGDSNPACNVAQLLADNAVNTVAPTFVDAAGGDFRLADGTLAAVPAFPLPELSWADAPVGVPPGATATAVPTNRAGDARDGTRPGAY